MENINLNDRNAIIAQIQFLEDEIEYMEDADKISVLQDKLKEYNEILKCIDKND